MAQGILDDFDLSKLLGLTGQRMGEFGAMPQAGAPGMAGLFAGGLNNVVGQPDAPAPAEAPPPQAAAPGLLDGIDLAGGNVDTSATTAPQGFLGRLMATDPSGLTFQNKLMAAGSMLKGEGGQAMEYLGQQQDRALKARMLAQQQARASAQAQAFMTMAQSDPRLAKLIPVVAAMGPDFDLGSVAKAEEAITPKMQFLNQGANIVSGDPSTGKANVAFAGVPEKPPQRGMKWDPESKSWVADEAAIAVAARLERDRAKALLDYFHGFAPPRPAFQGSWIPEGAEPLPP